MRRLFFLFGVAALAALPQNYASSGTGPVTRLSFLRQQWSNTNPLGDSSLILDLPMVWPYLTKTYYDISANHDAATLNGTFQNTPTGKIGAWTAYFNQGIPNSFSVSPTPTIPANFTALAWVHPNAASGGFNRIIDANYTIGLMLATDSPATHYQVIVNSNGSGGLGSCIGGTVSSPAATGIAWPNNPWQLVAVTYNGTSAALYVNGAQVAGPCAFTYNGAANTLQIGNCAVSGQCSSDHWDGSIQGVRIWGRVLSGGEILALYSAENH